MHNLSILAGLIDGGGGIVAPYCIARVVIVIAKVDHLCKCSLGHDALPKILAGCRNSRGVWRINRVVWRGVNVGVCGTFL